MLAFVRKCMWPDGRVPPSVSSFEVTEEQVSILNKIKKLTSDESIDLANALGPKVFIADPRTLTPEIRKISDADLRARTVPTVGEADALALYREQMYPEPTGHIIMKITWDEKQVQLLHVMNALAKRVFTMKEAIVTWTRNNSGFEAIKEILKSIKAKYRLLLDPRTAERHPDFIVRQREFKIRLGDLQKRLDAINRERRDLIARFGTLMAERDHVLKGLDPNYEVKRDRDGDWTADIFGLEDGDDARAAGDQDEDYDALASALDFG